MFLPQESIFHNVSLRTRAKNTRSEILNLIWQQITSGSLKNTSGYTLLSVILTIRWGTPFGPLQAPLETPPCSQGGEPLHYRSAVTPVAVCSVLMPVCILMPTPPWLLKIRLPFRKTVHNTNTSYPGQRQGWLGDDYVEGRTIHKVSFSYKIVMWQVPQYLLFFYYETDLSIITSPII